MPAKSKAQQKFMGLVHAYKKGDIPASKVNKSVKDAAKLPNKVSKKEFINKFTELLDAEMESCGYVFSAKDPSYKLKSPGGTGEEDKKLKEKKDWGDTTINYKKDTPRSLKKSRFKQLDALVPKGRVNWVINTLKKEIRGIKINHEEVDSYTKDGLILSKFKKDDINKILAIVDHSGGLFESKKIMNEINSYKQFVKYMNDFYGPKGVYPDKKKRTLKMKDIGLAYSVLLKKKPDFEIGYDSTDREMLRDILIKMKKLDPDYSKKEAVNEKMRPAVKKLLKQKGYGPIFQAIDNSKRQFKQMKYSRGEIQDTLIDMFGKEDPKILQKIKESINEAVNPKVKKQASALLKRYTNNWKKLEKETEMLMKFAKKNKANEMAFNFEEVLKKLKGTVWEYVRYQVEKPMDDYFYESIDEYSGMSKWQRDRLDQLSKEKGKKPKKVSRAVKKKQDAWAKKYYTKGGGINIAKWKKDGSPAFPKESVNEDRTASIIQHHERELQKYLDKPNKSYRDEEEIQRLRNAIAYAKSKQESVDEDVYIGYYKNKKVKVTAKSSKEAQKQIVKKLRIPKRDYDIASIQNLTKTKQNKHKFESINEKKKMFPPKKMTPKQAKEYKKFIDYAKMGIEYQIDMSLFESVNEVERDYKAEYRKFQSSTKAKKYRAELNKYNRQKGTYGNGDGKDASHKGGKIVGFEAQSKNRGRAEKSRLKKEMVEEVTKGKGVQKIFDIHKNGYGKLGGRMLDSLSAGLFVQLYDKAPDNIKEKMNKMNEKRLYIVIGKMWDKFGKGVKLS
jgi:hypothetical protein